MNPSPPHARRLSRSFSPAVADVRGNRVALGASGHRRSIVSFSCFEYLDTLPVTNGDAALLSTRQPLLVGRAIAHILRGSLNRAVLAALLAALALSLLWIIAASVGRSATVRALLDYFRQTTFDDVPLTTSGRAKPRPFAL